MIKYNQKIDDIQVLLPILKPFGTRSWPRTVQLGVGARLAAESSFFEDVLRSWHRRWARAPSSRRWDLGGFSPFLGWMSFESR